ncbi:MAG: hypothetical protein WAU49_04435, partial [Steroidobacteraceae bacterium]
MESGERSKLATWAVTLEAPPPTNLFQIDGLGGSEASLLAAAGGGDAAGAATSALGGCNAGG